MRASAILLVFLMSIGVALRFTHLQEVPPGLYVDEASIAQNALHILNTGRDEWGYAYPTYFKAFGEYKNPLFIYSIVPIYKMAGASIDTTRLTSAIWGILTVIAIGIAGYLVTGRKKLGTLALLVALFLPWHFYNSRIAFEAISMPLFLALLITTVAKYQKSPRFFYLWISIVLTGCMFYSYTSARFISPILTVFMLYLSLKKHALKTPFLALLFLLILIPALSWNAVTENSLFARYEQIKSDQPLEIMQNYFRHMNPLFWFISGDSNIRHTAGKPLIPLSFAPFFLLGLFQVIRKYKSDVSIFLLLNLILAPIPASLTRTDPNALRIIHIIPVIVIIIILGIKEAISYKSQLKKWVVGLLVLMTIVEHLLFYGYFFTDFRQRANWWFDVPYIQSFDQLSLYQESIWVHHYLLHSSHQVTYDFLCTNLRECAPKYLQFSEDATSFYPNQLNAYFGDDCARAKTAHRVSVIYEDGKVCLYR